MNALLVSQFAFGLMKSGHPQRDAKFQFELECNNTYLTLCYFRNIYNWKYLGASLDAFDMLKIQLQIIQGAFTYFKTRDLAALSPTWTDLKIQRRAVQSPTWTKIAEWRILAPTPTQSYKTLLDTTNHNSNAVMKTLKITKGVTTSRTEKIPHSLTVKISAAFKRIGASSSLSKTWSKDASKTFKKAIEISYQVTIAPGDRVLVKQLVGRYGPFEVHSGIDIVVECFNTNGGKCTTTAKLEKKNREKK